MFDPTRLRRIIEVQNEIVGSRFDRGSLITKVTALCLQLIPTATGSLLEVVEGDTTVVVAATPDEARVFLGTTLLRSASVSGECLLGTKTLHLPDLRYDDRPNLRAYAESGVSSVLATPLRYMGDSVGVLKVYSDKPHTFLESDIDTLQLYAGVVGACMGHTEEYVRMQDASHQDALTNLLNRRAFDNRLPKEMNRSCADNSSLVLAILDLDKFKNINDTKGHAAGDEVLREVAALITQGVRSTDLVFRLGGDEFAILFPNTDIENAVGILLRLRASIEARPLGVGVSFGARDQVVTDPQKFYDEVDQVLYRNKRSRKLSASQPR